MTLAWTWSKKLVTDYTEMDETHQEFVTLCAALALDASLPETKPYLERLDALIAHSIIHFDQENNWMKETNFPPAGCHQREHDSVLEIMQEVRRRVADGEVDLGQSLAEELPAWFENHVDNMDNMLAKFMINHAQEAKIEQVEQTLA